MKLRNKTAVITGGTSGIGLAIAELFVTEGARVGIFGRSEESFEKAKKVFPKDRVFMARGDVAKIQDLDLIYRAFFKSHGKIDVLVVNAGIFKAVDLATVDEPTFQELIDINLKGAFFSVQRALPFLNNGGSIILTASVSAMQGTIGCSVYSATKAAVVSLAQSFAAELLKDQIRVNSISPGFVRTGIQEKLGITEEMITECERSIPIRRCAQASEIAKAALFLASDDSSYMTGTDLIIDGGLTHISPPF
jgi:NAD(P)-dependent dehydrogenase (short-subunit alcohol dehydrogenase family)